MNADDKLVQLLIDMGRNGERPERIYITSSFFQQLSVHQVFGRLARCVSDSGKLELAAPWGTVVVCVRDRNALECPT